MLRRLYDWTMSLARARHAERALFGVSFVESSFFPIPPDVLMVPMVISRPQRWMRIAAICTVASVLGAFLGYVIGLFLYETLGRHVLAFYGKEDAFDQITGWYNSWGAWAILFGAITPFPYKVLTIFSGATGLNFAIFTLYSIIGRGFRFFLVSLLLRLYGEPVRTFIEKYLGLLFTLFCVLLVSGFYAVKFMF